MKEEKHIHLIEEVEKNLGIKLPSLNHSLPKKGDELNSAFQVLMELKDKHIADSEITVMLNQEEEWLNQCASLLSDPDAIPAILLEQLENGASLKLENGAVPKNTQELNIWKQINAELKDQNPQSPEIKEEMKNLEEFLGYFNGNVAFEYANAEIANRIYSQTDELGALMPANKEELFEAKLTTVGINDFDDFTEKTKEQIKTQEEGFQHLFNEFGVTQQDFEDYIAQTRSIQKSQSDKVDKLGSVNEKAYQYIDEMYYSLSYQDKEGNRYAASPKEIENAEKLIQKAEAATDDTSDKELQELILANKEHLHEAKTRKFAGAWWIIIAAGIMAIIELFGAFSYFGSEMSLENAKANINARKNRLNNSIEQYERMPEITKEQQKKLDETKESLKEYQEMKPEEYARDYQKRMRNRGIKSLFWALVSVGWIVGYFFASRPYGYDRFKRQKQYAALKKATGWGAKILTGFLGILWSMPITTYITKYSDGSEERDSDAMGVLGIQIIGTIMVLAMVLFIAKAIIPILTIIAYIRNYPGKVGARQVNNLFKDGKSLTEKYIDKIKNKNAA